MKRHERQTYTEKFYGRTKGEAKSKASEYKLELDMGEVVDKTITFGEWADKWLDTYKKGNVKSITFDGHYKNVVNNHLKPYFGGYKISAIKPINIQGFYKTKGNVSHSLIKKCQSCLYAILETAVDNDIIIKNLAKNIKSPSGKPVAEKKIYTQSEADEVIEFAKSHIYGLGIIIILKTGVRRGELVALKWSDVDFEKNVLHVQRAASDVYILKKRVVQVDEGSALTKNHNRYIPFDNVLKEALLASPCKSEYIIPNTKNEINSSSNYSNRMYKTFMSDFSKAHENISVLNPHELRHTYGTL